MADQLNFKLIFLIVGGVFLLASILLKIQEKEKLSLFTLLISSFFIFLFGAFLFNYLNIWDERFHALVGKNLLNHPFKPTLYDDPVVNVPYDQWHNSHIWLHKQPLFLWQIALSFKIFGVSVYSLRIPSVLLGCATVYAAYRSGKILGNKNVGYYTAFLITTSFYLIELISGYGQTDHNDVSFVAYITLSIWCLLEYNESKKIKWVILLGCFAGFAILCKWLVGLLVYLIWGIYTLLKDGIKIKKHPPLLLALTITVIIVLPWQLYISYAFPKEAAASYQYNFEHLFGSVEGHSGDYWYHFKMIGIIYGAWVPYLLLPAFFIFYRKISDKKIFWAFLISILFVYAFFTFTTTKMPSFTMVVALPVFIALAFFIDHIFSLFKRINIPKLYFKVFVFVFTATLIYFRVDVLSFKTKHAFLGRKQEQHIIWRKNARIFQELKLPSNAVIFNVKGLHYVEAMFYTGLPAYNFIPNIEQYNALKKDKRTIALFVWGETDLPAYLTSDPEVILMDKEIRKCE